MTINADDIVTNILFWEESEQGVFFFFNESWLRNKWDS